jgi:acyl carrier protein
VVLIINILLIDEIDLGSVKSNIGHTEAASGVAALIKLVLMMQHGEIPAQANFSVLNPKIASLEQDNMEITLTTKKWDVKSRVGLINNYGAAGSNAACVVKEGPKRMDFRPKLGKYPLFISGHSISVLSSYCRLLSDTILELALGTKSENAVADLTFSLSHQQNHDLPYVFTSTASSIEEIEKLLVAASEGKNVVQIPAQSATVPIVFVFGGQTSDSAGIPEDLYRTSTVLKDIIDECDVIIQELGCDSLFPAIFNMESINSIVTLHAILFAVQYACAKSWTSSGLSVSCAVGHSFGQISALVFAGVLSLRDGIRYVVGRASVIESKWGLERGSMIHVEADSHVISEMLLIHNNLEIACYNGPGSHVLVGSKSDVDQFEEYLKQQAAHSSPRYKRLKITHGFHSRFCDDLIPELHNLAQQLSFSSPDIAIETCSDCVSWKMVTPGLLAQHTRAPVFFKQAIERIIERHGACVWLEAGVNSKVIGLVRKITDSKSRFEDIHLSISTDKKDPISSLAETTSSLWKMGYRVQFWPFNPKRNHVGSWLSLPPYVFERTKHWLDWVDHVIPAGALEQKSLSSVDQPPKLLTISKYHDKKTIEFEISPQSLEYKSLVQGHAVLGQPLCPAPLYIDLVARATRTLVELEPTKGGPSIWDLEIKGPLGHDHAQQITLLMHLLGGNEECWRFVLSSESKDGTRQEHATGRVNYTQKDYLEATTMFSRYQRLISKNSYQDIEKDRTAESISGNLIYKLFSRVVTYADIYKGVKTISAKGNTVTAEVVLSLEAAEFLKESIYNPLAIDNFIQVSGLHVNCLTHIDDNEVYVCTRIDRFQVCCDLKVLMEHEKLWRVYSNYEQTQGKEIVNDIFVFDEHHRLQVIIHGARFMRVSISSLVRVLSKANQETSKVFKETTKSFEKQELEIDDRQTNVSYFESQTTSTFARASVSTNVQDRLKKLLVEILEVPKDSINEDSLFENLGVDSLLATEMLGEVSKEFKLEIPVEDWSTLLTVKQLVDYLNSRLNIPTSTPDSNSRSGSLSDTPHQDISFSTTDRESTSASEVDAEVDKTVLGKFQKIGSSYYENKKVLYDDSSVSEMKVSLSSRITATNNRSQNTIDTLLFQSAQRSFDQIRENYDKYAAASGFKDFWSQVYPTQARLVTAYVVEAFEKLGCSLSKLNEDDTLRPMKVLPKHRMLMMQLHNILKDACIIRSNGSSFVRTKLPVERSSATEILQDILVKFPQHTAEHKLLHVTGSKLAECLVGEIDPLLLLFRKKEHKAILEDVYRNGPMYSAITEQLGDFLVEAMEGSTPNGGWKILEVGAGTGGTTNHIVKLLTQKGIPFHYTFTDIGSSLVTAARKNFDQYPNMEFRTLDIEKDPPEELLNQYHIVLSTNCIHATRSITFSATNIRRLLREDGFLSLVEFTRNIYWFDLVFGLLDGWWSFEDGRLHVLADQWFWNRSLRDADFNHVTWTNGLTPESQTLRIITAFPTAPMPGIHVPNKSPETDLPRTETLGFHQVGSLQLTADIYFPITQDAPTKKRPVGMILP